jgi:hydroxyethylthiazole kinase-like uncharacterized protein yjeF
MKIVTAEEMRRIDRETIEEYGVPGIVLMERAGLSVAAKIRELYEKRKVIVLAGGGNNGGDGLVAARDLFSRGWNVKVLLLSREAGLSPDCRLQYRMAKKSGVPVEFRNALTGGDLHSAVVVDAVFGTGINKPVVSPISDLIAFLNAANCPVISVDIPSGISADTGKIMGDAVRADVTVTFGLAKAGHFLHPGAEYTGRLCVEDIGFPAGLLRSDSLAMQTFERDDAAALLPERPAYSHKGDYGHVLVVAGSRGKTGAALMTAKSCLRAGAGMVTIGIPESLADIYQSRVTEEMILPLPDRGSGTVSEEAYHEIAGFLNGHGDVLAIGPGLTSGKEIANLMQRLLATVTVPAVLDADALNALSGKSEVLARAKAPLVLTPHPGEMARLLLGRGGRAQGDQGRREKDPHAWEAGLRTSVERDRIDTARSFAEKTGIYLVLKGVPTVIAGPEGGIFLNTSGNPGMATAGAGDVLTGVIAAFLGQGLNPLDASVLGVYMHGLSGDIGAEEKGMHSLIASDIIDNLPRAFLALQ